VTFLSLRKDLAERCPNAEYFDLRFKDRIYAKEPDAPASSPAKAVARAAAKTEAGASPKAAAPPPRPAAPKASAPEPKQGEATPDKRIEGVSS
jgi:hypothetical protein